jgi:hypothetical protein
MSDSTTMAVVRMRRTKEGDSVSGSFSGQSTPLRTKPGFHKNYLNPFQGQIPRGLRIFC